MDRRMQEMVGKAKLDDDDIEYLRSRPFDWDFWTARSVVSFFRSMDEVRQIEGMDCTGCVVGNRPDDYPVGGTND